jgi:cytochrome c553
MLRVQVRRYLPAIVLGLFLFGTQQAAAQTQNDKPSLAAIQFFETKVRPLLAENCYRCHGPEKQKGSLRLDSLAMILQGGDDGPAIVPGDPAKSLLMKAIGYKDDELKMPPSKKLSNEQIEALTQWVKMGAPWPGADKVVVAPRKGEMQITDKDRQHWAFRPIKRSPLPKVKNAGWVANPIDAFILAGLESKGLEPNPPASKRELLRRVHYDLTGLPPTPQEVEAFLANDSPRAYEEMVDKLLVSPHFGEKWARHWLDLVRYAETNSYERDNPKPHVWRYRDYVIRSFNEDKPYDRFIREQIAGDELPDRNADSLIATGYYRLGVWDDEPTDAELARYEGLDDLVATTSQVFLGLTVDCARCHDHKIDPIPQKDYYRLLSFFQNINHFRNGGPTDEVVIGTSPDGEKIMKDRSDRRKVLEERQEALQQQLGAARMKNPRDEDLKRLLSKEHYAEYLANRKELDQLRKMPVPRELALGVTETGSKAKDTHVLFRGNPAVPGPLVQPGFIQVLTGEEPKIPPPAPGAKTTGRRTALANWLTSPDNQLTPRVMANRLWQYHFGRGIVRSPSDFGFQGIRPTHPELLDWLASEFIAQGWHMRPIHRLILTSNAYKMSSKGNAKALAQDPSNDHLWRFDMRRLTAEEIRDSILSISGSLNLKMYGPSVYPEIPREVLAGQSVPGRGWKKKSTPEDQNRRSIYVHVKRSLLYPILEIFDLAEADRSTAVRFSSTQPTQALAMLNSDFINKQAAAFAHRLKQEAPADLERQVRLALYLATSRQPEEKEIRRGAQLVQALQTNDGLSADTALQTFCLMVLNLNEFVYLD